MLLPLHSTPTPCILLKSRDVEGPLALVTVVLFYLPP